MRRPTEKADHEFGRWINGPNPGLSIMEKNGYHFGEPLSNPLTGNRGITNPVTNFCPPLGHQIFREGDSGMWQHNQNHATWHDRSLIPCADLNDIGVLRTKFNAQRKVSSLRPFGSE